MSNYIYNGVELPALPETHTEWKKHDAYKPASKPTRYFYNETELPALPQWDKEKYPYAVITKRRVILGILYLFTVSAEMPYELDYAKVEDSRLFSTKLPAMRCSCMNGDGAWSELEAVKESDVIYSNIGGFYFFASSNPLWANFDFYYDDPDNVADGTLCVAASDPVPVGDPTDAQWSGHTFYSIIGNKWVKHDAVVPAETLPEPEAEATYRWKLQDNALVSVGANDNPITTLKGGIVNGVFDNARYKLATPFNLLHNKPWVLEWRMSGDVTIDAGMAKIWDESGNQTDATSDSVIFRKTTKSITLTSYGTPSSGSGKTHIHHGVQLDKYGIDYTAEHLYRLENEVNADGTNMVYLYVDGVKIAPMTHTFSNSGDEGDTDWVVGRNFSFGYMGVPRYIMTGFIMDDIAVWEDGK